MISWTFVLPYPPSVNHYKKLGKISLTKSGKLYQARVNSPETLNYYKEVHWKVAQERIGAPRTDLISMTVDLHPPDNRKRDIDGPLKVLLDSLQRAAVYKDDCQIYKLVVEKKWVEPQGLAVVNIYPWEAPQKGPVVFSNN